MKATNSQPIPSLRGWQGITVGGDDLGHCVECGVELAVLLGPRLGCWRDALASRERFSLRPYTRLTFIILLNVEAAQEHDGFLLEQATIHRVARVD